MKFLILLPYFNRPNLVRFAINSVIEQSYQDWELVICDDGSDISAEQVLSEMFINDKRIKLKRLNDSIHQKEVHGSRSGIMLNEAMSESDSQVAIVLCDDDGLFPESLKNLKDFYEKNLDIMYSYGQVSIYDPTLINDYKQMPVLNLEIGLNHSGDVSPANSVDASQVSWRINSNTNNLFPHPQTAALDAVVFEKLKLMYGLCKPNNVIVQYKGWFLDQMGNRLLNGIGIEPMIR